MHCEIFLTVNILQTILMEKNNRNVKADLQQNPCIFLATYWNLSLKSGNLNFLLQNLANSGQVSMKNPFYNLESYF